jgi:hypothetical protein
MGKPAGSRFALTLAWTAVWAASPAFAGFYASPAVVGVYVTG